MKSKLAVLLLVLLACIPLFSLKKYGNGKGTRFGFRDVEAAAFAAPAVITQESIVDYVCMSNPGNPPSGKIRVYCDSGTGLLTCLSSVGANVCPSGGGGGSAVGPVGTAQGSDGAGNFTALGEVDNGTTYAINRDVIPLGPNPYVDVRSYGVRSTVTSGTPFVPGITATISGSSFTASLSAANTFRNGDGVTIYGAGSICTLTTPVTPTVTPSLAAAGTGTGLVVNAPAGAGANGYAVVARDKLGCMTPASLTGTTATANTLGSQSVAVTGFTRSGSTVTATTSSPHGLAAGAHVVISNSANIDNTYFGGSEVVATVPDNTHFTFVSNNDVADGAPTASQGGGTAFWWNANHLSWTPVSNATEYYIYGRISGSLTLMGVSRPQNAGQSIIDATWDDFGSPMMDGILLPFFVPSSPPVSPLPHPLTTTICSGAGTTTLTLCGAAVTGVTGATILFDNAPNIQTAATHTSNQSLLYFPSGTYVVNSYLTIPSSVSMQLAGANLWLNDTMEMSSIDKFYGTLLGQGASSTSFGWAVGGFITANRANPGVWSTNGGDYTEGIQINGSANGQLLFVLDGGSQSQFKNVNFNDAPSADYMGMNILVRAGFWNSFDTVSFNTGPGQYGGGFLGSTATPAAYFVAGAGTFRQMSVQDRGIFVVLSGSGGNIEFTGQSRAQGIITPFLTNYNTGGITAGIFNISDVEIDTSGANLFANLVSNTGSGAGISVNIVQGVNGHPTNGFGLTTGKPFGFVVGGDSQNFSAISAYGFTNNPVQVSGIGEFMYPINNTAVASLAVSSGGSVPVGTICYALTMIDVNGQESTVGPSACATTTGGNQTVTVTPPAAPTGAVGWRAYRNGALVNFGSCGVSFFTFAQTFVDMFSFSCGESVPGINRAGASSISSAGLSGFALNLLGGGFKDVITGTFTAARAQTLQDVSDTFVYRNSTDTLTLKTMTSPVLNGTISGTGVQGTDTKVMSAGTISGTAAALCTDASGGATTSGCPSSASFYQTVAVAGSASPQEPIINFIAGTNVTIACPDNSGATRTDCTITASNTGATAFSALTASTNSNSGTFAVTAATWDFTGAVALKAPVASGFAPTVSGSFGYNSTANKWVFGQNGATVSFGLSAAGACASHNWVSTDATAVAVAVCTQPAFTDISGTITTAQQPNSTVNAVTNDTNVTGAIAGQTLTLGWTGTLAKGRTLATTFYTDQGNTISTGAQDFSAATSLKVPVGAGLALTTSGLEGYDSTANKWVFGQNGTTVSFGLSSSACSTHQFVNTPATGTATASCTQPAFTDISGVATGAQLPNPSASTLGGIESFVAVAHQWINTISTSGVPGSAAIGTNDISPDLYAAGGGTAQAQTVTLSPAATSLVAGLQVYWLPSNANSGAAPTLAVNGLTAKSITKFGNSTPLVASDLTTNAIAFAVYDGTEFQLQNPQTLTGGGSSITLQNNGVNNVTQTSLNFIASTTNAIGGTITPSNPSGAQEIMELTGRITPFGGGTGLSNPTAHSLLVTEGSSNFNLLTSPSTNGACVVFFNVTASAAVDPTCGYQGVPVNAQSGNYSPAYTDRLSYIKESGVSTSTITLPQVTGITASNFSFVTQNLNSGNETITANAADKIDNSATGGSATLLPNFAAFVYQDSSSAPGNWWTLKLPTFGAFGATCANIESWSTTSGFTCVNATGSMFANFSAHQFLGNNTAGSAAPSPSLIGSSDVSPNWYAAATGIAQAQVVALTPAVTALTIGTQVHFLPVANNTAANPSLAVNGLTAKSITKYGGSTNLVANDIITTAIAVVEYDGTQWELLNPQTAATLGSPCTSTGNSLQYDNAGSFGCVTPFTFSGSTITSASSGILDLSAATGASAFKVPVQAGATAASDGVVDYDSTGKITHIRTNAADSFAAATTATSTTTTFGLFATAVAGIYTPRAIAAGDLPATVVFTNQSNTFSSGTQDFTAATITMATQSVGDSSTKGANTAFVTTAVNNAISGVNPAVAVLAATTGSNLVGTYSNGASGIGATFTITATGAFTLDGVSIATIGQRVLLKDQSSAFQNGVYTATIVGTTGVSAVFTRALDYDTPSDINNTGAIPVVSGTVNADTSWLLTSTVVTMGTDSLTYAQFTLAPTNIVTASANFTNGDLIQAAGANKTASDSGIATANVVTAASNAGAAKQVWTAGGANKTAVAIDFPQAVYAPAADCVNAVAGSGWSTGATPAALCRAGTNNKDALLSPWGASDVGYFKIHLPNDWDSAASLDISIDLTSTDATNGHTIIMQAATACAKGDGSTTDDVAFNTAQSFGTITLNGNANRTWNATLTGLTKTGCIAGSTLWVKISRTTDTATNVGAYGATVDVARLITVQAN